MMNSMIRTVFAVVLASMIACAQSSADKAIQKKDGSAGLAAFRDAVKTNIRPDCPHLIPIVAAIRYAENGKKGKEYGILHPRCEPTYRSQAGWCAATVQKNWDRWVRAGRKGSFIKFLGSKYCPVGADNDPNGLNKHWVTNVTHFAKKFGFKG